MIGKILSVLIPLTAVSLVAYWGREFSSIGFVVLPETGLSWYDTLTLPSWAPPGTTIGIAWGVIYVLTAISAILFYNQNVIGARNYWVTTFFIANALLNVFWSYLFFVQNEIGYAALVALALTITVYVLIKFIRRISVLFATLLYPYVFWSGFATVLTAYIWYLNTSWY